jgi:histidine triad (HIT) family protein
LDDCLFCRIASKEVAAEIVAERPNALAFRDINPQAPVHILVVPRDHIPDIGDLGPERGDTLTDIFAIIGELATGEGIAESGFRVVCNIGEGAGQEVPHLHFHVLGGRSFRWPPG